MDRSNFAAEWCQHRNNTVAVPGSEWPNPITRPFDTETDSDPDPDLASPWTFSDGLNLGNVYRFAGYVSLSGPKTRMDLPDRSQSL
ncbi:MAG: hypothetical protein ACOX52_12320 [Verrucomicrobiota bacterium]